MLHGRRHPEDVPAATVATLETLPLIASPAKAVATLKGPIEARR